MLIYALRRLNLFVITLLILSLISYSILRLDASLTWRVLEFWQGWFTYLSELRHLNFGLNAQGTPIASEIFVVFGSTLELCLFAFLLSLIIAIPTGTIAGVKQGKTRGKVISFLAMLGFATPLYWIALTFILLFSLHWDILPVSGRHNPLLEIRSVTGFATIDLFLTRSSLHEAAFKDVIYHMILPCTVLAIPPAAQMIRLMRSSVAKVMTHNYIRVAKIRGLSKYQITVKHILRNAIPPIVPMLGVQFSSILTFAILTESIFNWPGIGRWLLEALAVKDYSSIQAGVFVVASFVLCIQILTEVIGKMFSPLARKEWNDKQ